MKNALLAALLLASTPLLQADAPKPAAKTAAEILAAAPPEHWRDLDPESTLLMRLQTARGEAQVLIELAPRFAPRHVANIRALSRASYFDGLAVLRVQDGFVSQWGDPGEEKDKTAKPLPAAAAAKLPAEFDIALAGLPLSPMRDSDGWAPLSGHVDGFPVAADPRTGRAWLAHCYGMVGAGRGMEADSSNGSSLYAVIGHAPRTLDLNITTVGRVIQGIEHLSSLPRGPAPMGFYTEAGLRTPILSARLLADLPAAQRPDLQLLRTDSPSWTALQDARRQRSGWFVHNPGRLELCASTVPSRPRPAGGSQ